MAFEGNGEIVPTGGGDVIPLPRSPLVLGRRESCDICLDFPNISGRHCELFFQNGFWFIRDLNSKNGLKVNGDRLPPGGKRGLHPGDTISIGKRDYKIEYTPTDRMSRLAEMEEEDEEDILSVPLLEKAGLEIPHRPLEPPVKHDALPPVKWEEGDEDDDDE